MKINIIQIAIMKEHCYNVSEFSYSPFVLFSMVKYYKIWCTTWDIFVFSLISLTSKGIFVYAAMLIEDPNRA